MNSQAAENCPFTIRRIMMAHVQADKGNIISRKDSRSQGLYKESPPRTSEKGNACANVDLAGKQKNMKVILVVCEKSLLLHGWRGTRQHPAGYA